MSGSHSEAHSADKLYCGIDSRSLQSGPAGIATYVKNLLLHLPELLPVNPPHPRNNFLWNQLVPPTLGLLRGWRLFHGPCYTGPLWMPIPLVITAPDVSYLVNPEWYPHTLGGGRLRYYRASLRRADRIIVTSEFSRSELTRVLPEVKDRIRCTYLAASSDFRKSESEAVAVRRKYALPSRFLLHVGDLHRRRNLPLLQAVARRTGLPLVLIGRILRPEEVEDAGPWHFQNLSLHELVGFYSAASALIYASRYEGFGLPLLEAFACELPVVAVGSSSIPEVCADAAVLVAPQESELAAGVRQVLSQPSEWIRRGKERLEHFSWERTALATRAIYRELV